MAGSGKGDYYLNLAKEDYYLEGGEPEGEWFGASAESLGAKGKVKKEDFSNLLSGYSIDGKEVLVQNAGSEKRQSGWDLTFSAPKTVSVAWSQSEGHTRREIQAAHKQAVNSALNYLNDNAGFTRRGKGGVEKEQTGLIAATFEHGTSRAGDPQLHTHAIVLNLAKRSDGTTGGIESKHLFTHKMAAGAVYRAELASQLEKRLGLEAEKKNSWFELKGVDRELTKEFSKRREEILETLDSKGFSSAEAAKVAALDTRGKKLHTPRSELFKEWQQLGQKHGWGNQELEQLTNKPLLKRDPIKEKQETLTKSLEKITDQKSYFTEKDLVRTIAEEAQGRGIGADEVIQISKTHLNNSLEIIHLGELKGEKHFTTKEMLELEKKLISSVQSLETRDTPQVTKSTLDKVFSKKETISDEQKNAVRHITQGKGAVKVVSGMAGSGKSFMLEAAREAWESSGAQVYGAAYTGKAAQGLQDSAGIKSDTIHKTLQDFKNGKLQLDKNSVLVVDEAGMLGTKKLSSLVEMTEKTGSKLVLVGDAKQLQPIEAGGAFKAVSSEIGQVELKEIRRQKENWAKEAVFSVAKGEGGSALEQFAERGLLKVEKDRKEAIKSLIFDWSEKGREQPAEHLILAGNNLEVKDLNKQAQDKRLESGKLGEGSIRGNSERFYVNDRVVMTRNSRLYGVRNGQLGTIEKIDEKKNSIKVKLDSGSKVRLPLAEYEHVKLGYAVTTHKAQGMTAENVYVLAGGSMQDRELSYVQLSRAKNQTKIYIDQAEAGENLSGIAKSMQKSRQKGMALNVLAKAGKARQLGRSINGQ